MTPYPINPINEYYIRNTPQVPAPYQQTFNFPPNPQQQMPQIHSHWVTSIEEAKAAMIDPLATNVFFDTSSGKIYMKNLGDNGKPMFMVYSIEEQAAPKDPIVEINSRLTNIEKFLGGMNNDKSISSNAGFQQSSAISKSTVAGSYGANEKTESTGFPENDGNDQW